MDDSVKGQDLARRYGALRRRTRGLFSLLAPPAFDARTIPLRHPIRFYEGHLAAFNLNMLHGAGLLEHVPNESFSRLFARGIDPDSEERASALAIERWPARADVAEYLAEADDVVEACMRAGARPEVLHICLEHEEMHQETLLYLIHQLPSDQKSAPAGYAPTLDGSEPQKQLLSFDGGRARLGASRGEIPFGWDNEFPPLLVDVDRFQVESHKVTNGEFLEFVVAGGYREPRYWSDAGWKALDAQGWSAPQFWRRGDEGWLLRTVFGEVELPRSWPAVVSHCEARAFARWKGMRLLTEAEFSLMAYGLHEAGASFGPRVLDGPADYDFHPVTGADLPRTAEGVVEPVGNGWEWTSTPFAGYPGFEPSLFYPVYSADFLDGRHFVLRGASPATPRAMIRPTFRNWFFEDYRYAYTTFRCAR